MAHTDRPNNRLHEWFDELNEPLASRKAITAFGCDENLVSLLAKCLANEDLAFPLRIHVRGIVEVYPCVVSGLKCPERRRPSTVLSEQPTNARSAESDLGNAPSGFPKLPVAHARSPSHGSEVSREAVRRACSERHHGQRGVLLCAGREATGIDHQDVRDLIKP